MFFLLLAGILSSFKKDEPRVLLFIEDNSMDLPYMLTHEALRMSEILKQSGLRVVVATLSGKPIKTDSITVKPDIMLSNVDINEYSGFILPCMAAGDTIVTDEEISFVRKVVNEGKPIAAQTAAVLILAKAGVLNGKKYAFPRNNSLSPDIFPAFNSGIYSGIRIVQDGNIITSGSCPMESRMTGGQDGTDELTRKLIQEIKARSK